MLTAFLVQIGIAGGIIVGRKIYQGIVGADEPPPPKERIQVAKVAEGDPVSLVFGRCRVSSPVIAWHGGAEAVVSGTTPTGVSFKIRILFVVGIPFEGGTTRIEKVYLGDYVANGIPFGLDHDESSILTNLIENAVLGIDDPEFLQAQVQFADGRSTQDISTAAPGDAIVTYSGVSVDRVPGFRGYITFYASISKATPNLPQFNFEVSTYPQGATSPYYVSFIAPRVGDDANPADVIAAILCDAFGKLGLDAFTRLDQNSFKTAGETLAAEGHGCSRAWEGRTTAAEMIRDVLEQVDGLMYEEPTTGAIVLKLLRADYDPNALLEVNQSNCVEVTNFAAGGWTNTVNKVRVVSPDRDDGYRESSATAQNMANAVGQDGETREAVINYPGCCTKDLRELLAARELAFMSRPLARCRVKVDRTFWNTRPGDVVRVVWPKLNIASRVFRVLNASRGTADENVVYLDLIEDYFYVHRARVSHLPPVAPFPSEADIISG